MPKPVLFFPVLSTSINGNTIYSVDQTQNLSTLWFLSFSYLEFNQISFIFSLVPIYLLKMYPESEHFLPPLLLPS